LASAGLLTRGIANLNDRQSGWDSANLITGTFLLPESDYPEAARIISFQRQAIGQLEALPSVASAGFAHAQPFLTWYDQRRLIVDGQPPPEPGHEPVT